MRCYQEIGLNPKALEWLSKNVNIVPDLVCPDCGATVTTKWDIESTEHRESFYVDGPNLRTFRLKDGRLTKEVVQAEPWSSEPMAFFCLEMGGRRKFLWTDEEIEEWGG